MLKKMTTAFLIRATLQVLLLSWGPLSICVFLHYAGVVEIKWSGGVLLLLCISRVLFPFRLLLRRLLFLVIMLTMGTIPFIVAVWIHTLQAAVLIAFLYSILQVPFIIWLDDRTKGYFKLD